MDYIKQNHFKTVKISLIFATIIGSIAYTINFILNRDKLHAYYDEKLKDYDEELIQKLVSFIFVTLIVLLILFMAIFLFFIIKEILSGVLAITILSTISLLYSFTVINQALGPTVIDIILAIIEITLGFLFSYLIKTKRQTSNRQPEDDQFIG
jgi:hypothetical protein